MKNKFTEIENEQEMKKMIEKRLEKLYKEAQPRKWAGYENMTPLKGMISKETIIDNGGGCFKIKEDDYIYEYISLLKKHNMNEIIDGLYNMKSYLDYYFGADSNDDLRNEILNNNTNGDDFPDISVLRKKNAAACSERAAMAQNILTFLGIESYYITGEIELQNKIGCHAFNIIKHDGTTLIYDSTAQVPIYKNGKIVNDRHYFQKLGNMYDEREPKLGDLIEADEYIINADTNGLQKQCTGKRRYGVGFLLLKDKGIERE